MCGKKLPTGDKRPRKYCSIKCRHKQEHEKYAETNANMVDQNGKQLSSQKVGTIGEMIVILDLLKKGYHVYRNIVHSSYCDLAIITGEKFLRIEVTVGYVLPSGKLCYPPHKKKRYDHLAVWTKAGSLTYLPELPPEDPLAEILEEQ
jgi:hypothetical protein